MSSNILTTAHLNYLYWSNPTVLVSDPPAFRLPPSICYAPLHLIHHYRTSSSISLNRPRYHMHPQSAPTILNMMKNMNNQTVKHGIKRKFDELK